MIRFLLFPIAGVALTSCGLASVSPLVTDADVAFDQRLVGTWEDSSARGSAVITAAGSNGYHIVYKDDDGKTGRFTGRLGRLGAHRVIDLQPDAPLPDASELYTGLLVRTHAILVIDSIGNTLHFRALESDSVKALLARTPGAVPHAVVEHGILLTAPSAETRRFLLDFVTRPGSLSEPSIWRRRPR